MKIENEEKKGRNETKKGNTQLERAVFGRNRYNPKLYKRRIKRRIEYKRIECLAQCFKGEVSQMQPDEEMKSDFTYYSKVKINCCSIMKSFFTFEINLRQIYLFICLSSNKDISDYLTF